MYRVKSSQVSNMAYGNIPPLGTLQGWVKEWSLGCVNSPPAAGLSQGAGYTLAT